MSDPGVGTGSASGAIQAGAGSMAGVIQTQQQGVQALWAIQQAIKGAFPNWVTVPATASSAGTAGQVAYDSTHFYVCIASSSWVRVSLGAW